MRRTLLPLFLLALSALACSLAGRTPTSAPNALATSAAATPTALAPQTSTAAPTVTLAPASNTLAPAPSAMAPPATAAPTTAPTRAATATTAVAGCKLAYTDRDSLYCVPESGAPKTLANQPRLFTPLLSPDGALIAYSVVITDDVNELWVAAIAEGGEAPHLLVGSDQLASGGGQVNSPLAVQWLAGTHTLVFDTNRVRTAAGSAYLNADLWKVDADSGAVSAILPAGQAGDFSLSPDGHTIAIARGAGIDLIDADGTSRRPNVLSFPPVTIFGNSTYAPSPQWSADGSYFTVAIPSPDPSAGINFYRVGTDGTVMPRGTLTGNFGIGAGFQTEISPDGAHVFIAQFGPGGSAQALHMLTLQAGAPGDKVFDHQPTAGVSLWSPDSQHFAYLGFPLAGSGRGYVVDAAGDSPQPFINNVTELEWLSWADASHLVYIAQVGGGDRALYRQALGSAPQIVASGLSELARFDVRP